MSQLNELKFVAETTQICTQVTKNNDVRKIYADVNGFGYDGRSKTII